MNTQTWILLALAATDAVIVGVAFVAIRSRPRMDDSALTASGAGLSAFAFHAFMFFEGAFLALQLATVACIFLTCWAHRLGGLRAR